MRALAEETGFVAREYDHIGELRVHAIMTQKVQVVVMRHLKQTGSDNKAKRGISDIRFETFGAIERSIDNREIDNTQTIAVIEMYKNWRKQNSQEKDVV